MGGGTKPVPGGGSLPVRRQILAADFGGMLVIALTGASGYFGSMFRSELERRGLAYKRMPHETPNIGDVSLLINCAAYVDKRGVDYNEQDREQTLQANLLLPQALAMVCATNKVPILHLSTACLFQGDKHGNGWSEDDEPHLTVQNAGIYVASKLMAEKVVRQWEKSYICRVRLPFDGIDHPRNLLTKLQKFSHVVDETQSLTHRGDAVKA